MQIQGLVRLDAVTGTNGDDGETDALELLTVEHETAAKASQMPCFRIKLRSLTQRRRPDEGS